MPKPSGPLVVGDRLGPYKIEELIDDDSFAVWYRARDRRFDHQVLVKTLHARERKNNPWMHNGAAMLRTLNHPRIIRLLDYRDEREGGPFQVMESFPYQTLSRLLRDTAVGTWPRFLAVIRDLAETLAYCHSLDIVSRDVKPAHLLVDERDGRFHIKLKELGAGVHAGMQGLAPAGAPPYMGPEQWGAGIISDKTDVYSVGILIFYLLVGRNPLAAEPLTVPGFMERALAGLADDVFLELPPALRSLVARMLSRSPEARPAMREVHVELTHYIERERPGSWL
jgi:serine/threonine protein kinase